MKDDSKLEGILQRLTYFNNSKQVAIVPTYETVKWDEVKTIPFNLDLEDCTTNILYWLDKLLTSCGMDKSKVIALDVQSFKSFCSHPYIIDVGHNVKSFLPEYMKHLNFMFGVTGRWVEVGGRVFVENDCKGKTIMYAVDYEVVAPSNLEDKIEQQLESLLLHLGSKGL